ncbi:uncharacterized protein LOC128264614 [Drosophila gunungcola]|uniref:Kinetochore protein NDC80 n=1 Tax=Drosophila gunungcola TaxID=103775 RepID=A0A9P9YCD6_9MUSC|nr:uncharacterized protein LOC128264614 [Drosophila gunungcola]KAI8034330.1 hypothetical protein M5D96_012883 [Drosophila gunungcola]
MSHLMPRRTIEFRGDSLEDRGTVDKRQSRSNKRSAVTATPSSVQPNPRRPSASRLPLPLSLERDPANQMGATPNRGHRFVPSTAERPVPLHSDKKWVAERAQQILEYLNAVQHNEKSSGLGLIADLFNRAGGLRHMTIKQFVAILNFLFQHIWRNKVTVGQNHVEDITSAMQKLQYPNQVNKSWLVSPTTQHSFGHVIVLLDFLMDFAPPLRAGDEPFEEFPFMETTEHCESMVTMSTTQVQTVQLDEEVNALLFVGASKCITLWDQELSKEEAMLQAKTSDELITLKCGLPDRQDLDQKIGDLRAKLQQLDDKLQDASDDKKLEKLERICNKQKKLGQQLAASEEELNHQTNLLRQLSAKVEEKQTTIREQMKYEQRLRGAVNKQKYSAQQLKTLQIELNDMENYSKAYERQLKEVSDLELHQQVMVSRAKQKQLDAVEAFNSHARHMAMTCGPKIAGGGADQQLDLTLPLNPKLEDIAGRVHSLKLVDNFLQQQRQQNVERRQMLEQQADTIRDKTLDLDYKIADLESRLRAKENSLTKMEADYRAKREMQLQHQQQLLEDQQTQVAQLHELEKGQVEAQEQLKISEQKNEDLIAAAEKYQEQDHQLRNAALDDCEQKLAAAEKELQALGSTLSASQTKLSDAQERLQSAPLPSFDPVLNAIRKR